MTTAHLPQASRVSSAPLAIFVATQAEMKPIATAFKTHCRSDVIVRVGGEGRDLLLARTGVGPDHAETAARRLFEETPIAAAVSLGVAGGLNPQLHAGDLIVGDRVILRRDAGKGLHGENASRLESFSCDPGLQDAAMTILRRWDTRHALGPILTVDSIVLTSEEKRRLAVEAGAMALDMESAAVASAASACSVPFLAIRGILDAVDEDLAIGFDQFLNEYGEPQPLSLIRYLIAHPLTVSPLIGLGLRTKAICSRLGLLLRELATALR